MFDQLKSNVVPLPSRLYCMACGVKMIAPCGCDAPAVTLRERILAALEEHPNLSNHAIAKRIGCDETTVRRTRKVTNTAPAASVDEQRVRSDGSVFKLGKLRERHRKPAVKLFKARKVKCYKAPTNEKEQLIAFTRELSTFVMHFGIELREWLDTEPAMEAAGRDALAFTLSAFAQELQMLAQRVDNGGER